MISNSTTITEHRTIDGMGAHSLIQYQPLDYSTLRDNSVSSTLSMRFGSMDRLLEYNFKQLTLNAFDEEKRRLLQLADFARLSKVQIHFIGLNELQKKYAPHNCCTWFSGHKYHPECDMVQLLSAIQSQSICSPKKYNIKLIY